MARRNRTKTGELIAPEGWGFVGTPTEVAAELMGLWAVQLLDANNHVRTMVGAGSDRVVAWDWGPSLYADVFEHKGDAERALRTYAPISLESWVVQIDESFLLAARLIDSKEPPDGET